MIINSISVKPDEYRARAKRLRSKTIKHPHPRHKSVRTPSRSGVKPQPRSNRGVREFAKSLNLKSSGSARPMTLPGMNGGEDSALTLPVLRISAQF
ncbi:hypothetical protein ACFSHR_10215 [Azotobacter chroococcum]